MSGSSASCTICTPAAGRSWTLREFYPAALVAFGEDLAHPDALAVLAKAPAPELGRRLSAAQAAAVPDPLPGLGIEGFALPDNLMVPGAVEYGGGLPITLPPDGISRPFDALDIFEQCVAAAARHLRG